MQDELEDNQDDYCSLTHEYWCDLLSTIDVKDSRKSSATQIKKIAFSIAASLSDRNRSVRIPRKKKARTGVLRSIKGHHDKSYKHHITQRHCRLCKKSRINEQKYMPHSYKDCFGEITNQKTIEDGLGGYMGSRDEAVKQYKKS